MICIILEDADSEWVKDMLDWWNMWVLFVNHDSLDANMNYSHRQIFGTLPHNLDEEDLVNPQVSSLNLLKAQRARKTANTGKVANAPSAKHTASVRTGHGVCSTFVHTQS